MMHSKMSFATVLMALSVLSAVGYSVRADTVFMKDTKLRIEGKVLRETDEYVLLLVYNDKGQIRIPKSQIERIEYDIKTQLANLKDDDNAGKYKVGVWAMNKGMFPEAIVVFEDLKGKDGAGPDLLKLLGQAYEKRQQPDKALMNFNDYLRLHPEDTVVAERVKELSKEVNPEASADPKVPAKNLDSGLAGTGAWTDEKWPDAIPCTCQMTTDKDGKKIIVVQTQGGAKDKSAFTRTGNLNLTDNKEMVFRISQNGSTPINIAVAYINAKNEFMESKQLKVPANSWSTLSVKLDDKQFKSQANGWKFSDPLEGKENVQRISFLIYERRPITLWIDGIFFK
jgi:hypothetical protein